MEVSQTIPFKPESTIWLREHTIDLIHLLFKLLVCILLIFFCFPRASASDRAYLGINSLQRLHSSVFIHPATLCNGPTSCETNPRKL